jgi:hypothetical protein
MPPTQDDLEKLIKPGAALFLKNIFSDSKLPHFHILLNYPLGTFADIASVNSSTNILGTKDLYESKPACLSALIDSDKCENTPFLTEKSIFDCNKPQILTKNLLFLKFVSLGMRFDPLPGQAL